MQLPRVRLAALTIAVAAGCTAAPAAHAQTPPACQTNTGVNIDRPRLIAFGRTGVIKVFAGTSEAQATGTFSVTAKDPARPISHPVSVPYSSLATQGGNRHYRFKAEKGDGDAVAALTW